MKQLAINRSMNVLSEHTFKAAVIDFSGHLGAAEQAEKHHIYILLQF